jgi:hypothetical protein
MSPVKQFALPGALMEIGLRRYSLSMRFPDHLVIVSGDVQIEAPHLGRMGTIAMEDAHKGDAPSASILWHLLESEKVTFAGDADRMKVAFPCGCNMQMTSNGSPEDVVFHYPPRVGGIVLERWPADF